MTRFYFSEEQHNARQNFMGYYEGVLTKDGWKEYTNTEEDSMSDNILVFESKFPIILTKLVDAKKSNFIFNINLNFHKSLYELKGTEADLENTLAELTPNLIEEYLLKAETGEPGAI